MLKCECFFNVEFILIVNVVEIILKYINNINNIECGGIILIYSIKRDIRCSII